MGPLLVFILLFWNIVYHLREVNASVVGIFHMKTDLLSLARA